MGLSSVSLLPRLWRHYEGSGYQRGVTCGADRMLTCIAGTTGRPQVNLPLAAVGGLPVGLSLLGARGADEVLLACARDMAQG